MPIRSGSSIVVRASDVADAVATLALVFQAPDAALRRALRDAVREVNDVDVERDAHLVAALEDRLGTMRPPEAIHYFHGTRVIDPGAFCADGLLPLPQALNRIWAQLGALIGPSVPVSAWEALRQEMDNGRHGPANYRRAIGGSGPYGLLVREVFLQPEKWSSVDYLASPEIVADICNGACQRFNVDLAARYATAAIPCLIEFRVIPRSGSDDAARAVASAAWYVASTLLHVDPLDALHSFDGLGTSVPAADIVAVQAADDSGRRWDGPVTSGSSDDRRIMT